MILDLSLEINMIIAGTFIQSLVENILFLRMVLHGIRRPRDFWN